MKKVESGHLIVGMVCDSACGKYRIYITEGEYIRNGRISNAFTWQRVKRDGSLYKKEESGYGWTPENAYFPKKEIIIKDPAIPKKAKNRKWKTLGNQYD